MTTRLSCDSCETEVSGSFTTCEFCALNADDRALLAVFLRSRGNMKALERHLEVSYPTARSRFDALLTKLGLLTDGADHTEETLEALARGDITIDEAEERLGAS